MPPAPTSTVVHDWAQWTVQSVDVIVDPFTKACSVVESDDGEVGVQVGCLRCGEPLTDSSAVSLCEGDTGQ